MRFDSYEAFRAANFTAKVCILGSVPAGTTIARKLGAAGIPVIGATLVQKNLGRVRIADRLANGEDYPTNEELAGHHHMGGTRMDTDVTKSVVDSNSKVHGMDNLYVGGSSVFCSSGQCNPTTTITALACRPGDHLSKIVTV